MVQKLQVPSRQLVRDWYPGDRLDRGAIMNGADEHPPGRLVHAQNVRRGRDLQ